ncbi:MAG: thioredoxin domain-containing protein, partial [Myxococcales bacterium]|nr:thioredoxin domain-containing protein [Myxococcales bacterium]
MADEDDRQRPRSGPDGPDGIDGPAARDEAAGAEAAGAEPGSAPAGAQAPRRFGSAGGLLAFVAALGLGYFIGPTVRDWVFGAADAGPWQGYEDLARYRVELSGHEPQRGPDDALVTIIEFSDYECPYCQRAHGPLMDALAEHDDVRLIFKHMPLPMHAKAIPAARAAWAAQQQGKFWEMHDHLFEVGGSIDDIEQVAEDLGLDVARFRADMAGEAAGEAIEAD